MSKKHDASVQDEETVPLTEKVTVEEANLPEIPPNNVNGEEYSFQLYTIPTNLNLLLNRKYRIFCSTSF